MKEYMGYAMSILEILEDEAFISALYCNQSSIKGLFSCIHSMCKDRTDLYAGGIIQQQIFYQIKSTEKGSSSYSKTMIGDECTISNMDNEEVHIERIGKNITRDKNARNDFIKQEHKDLSKNQLTYLFPQNSTSDDILSGFALFEYFKAYLLADGKNFQQMLLNNDAFLTYAALSIGSDKEEFFKTIILNVRANNVNILCQYINVELYRHLSKTINLVKSREPFETIIHK